MDWKHAFEVVSNALGVVSRAGSIPGVNLIPYVSTIAAAASALKSGIDLGVKVAPYAEAVRETFANGMPTQEKLSALDARIAELRAIIHAPLPAKEDGEED